MLAIVPGDNHEKEQVSLGPGDPYLPVKGMAAISGGEVVVD